MAVSQKKLSEIFRKQCEDIPQRLDGYRDELLNTLADIVSAEREHATHATNIQQKVTDYCQSLGDLLAAKDSGK